MKPSKYLDEQMEELATYLWVKYGRAGTMDDFVREAKQALISLIKELVAEAKPSKRLPDDSPTADEDLVNYGYNQAINQFEQNLLKALEEV